MYYHHEENQNGGAVTTSTGSQDALNFNLGLKYTINKHFALHADYEYTNQGSSGGTSGYSRNRYFAGVTYAY
jgi:outer membrane autotransporter protein